MVRVLHICSLMLGGIETAIMNYYRHMDRDKVQFDFLCTYRDRNQMSVKQYYEEEAIALGARVFKLYSKINPLMNPSYYYSFFRTIKSNSDIKIIHIHGDQPASTSMRAFLARLAGLSVRIVHSHSVLDFSIKQSVFRPFLRFFATHWLGCSLDAGQSLFGTRAFNKSKKAIIFTNAFNLKLFRFNPSTRIRKRNELEIENNLIILAVARLHPQKNHEFLLDVFADLICIHPNAILLIAGDGDLRAKLEKKSYDLKITDNVRFLGARSDIADLMQAADIFVLPSIHEGLGIAAVEAQAAGLPCLLSDTIPKEVKVTDLVEFIPINIGSKVWVERVLNYINFERSDTLEAVRDAGYDINEAVKQLKNIYFLCE